MATAGALGASALRHVLLGVGQRDQVRDLVLRLPAARTLARRFVAGETRGEALAVARRLRARRMMAAVDFLGENVAEPAQAEAVAAEYRGLLPELAALGEPYVSIKLTHFGLDVDEELCFRLVQDVAAVASRHGAFVRIDMEGSAYTERTLRLFRRLHMEWPNVGVVLQAYLRRTAEDVEEMIELRARVRLCKGAYDEPAEIAFPEKAEVDESYWRLMERLLSAGEYPALATHDDRLIRQAMALGRDPRTFELQMLYGIRTNLQRALAAKGYRVRVYVPYGTHWYAYFLRRLAERPANLAFFLRSLFS